MKKVPLYCRDWLIPAHAPKYWCSWYRRNEQIIYDDVTADWYRYYLSIGVAALDVSIFSFWNPSTLLYGNLANGTRIEPGDASSNQSIGEVIMQKGSGINLMWFKQPHCLVPNFEVISMTVCCELTRRLSKWPILSIVLLIARQMST